MILSKDLDEYNVIRTISDMSCNSFYYNAMSVGRTDDIDDDDQILNVPYSDYESKTVLVELSAADESIIFHDISGSNNFTQSSDNEPNTVVLSTDDSSICDNITDSGAIFTTVYGL
jgi:hypothetical protein